LEWSLLAVRAMRETSPEGKTVNVHGGSFKTTSTPLSTWSYAI